MSHNVMCKPTVLPVDEPLLYSDNSELLMGSIAVKLSFELRLILNYWLLNQIIVYC